MSTPIVNGFPETDEGRIEQSVRPTRLADFVGQRQIKDNLSIAIEASRKRGQALDHVLLYGPAGCGKTTLAQVIANELGVGLRIIAAPLLSKKFELVFLLMELNEREVLFIDEIHRLAPPVEEVLYSAMEDFQLNLVTGQKSFPFALNHFTLVGATTRPGLITQPLRNRFGIVEHLNPYTQDELTQIVERSASILHIPCEAKAAAQIAQRARRAQSRQPIAQALPGFRRCARRWAFDQ